VSIVLTHQSRVVFPTAPASCLGCGSKLPPPEQAKQEADARRD
jgi:hypothetical protein